MIRPLRDWPLQAKFTALTMFISLMALSLFTGLYAVNEYSTARASVQRELQQLLKTLSGDALGPLAFNQRDRLDHLFSGLQNNPAVLAARLYDVRGDVAGEWWRPAAGKQDWPPLREAFDHNESGLGILHLWQTVRLPDGKRLGTLGLASDFMPVREQMRRTAGALLGIWLVCAGVAYLATQYLGGLVVKPVAELSHAIEQVTVTKDYSQRVPVSGRDEIGRLGEAFNEMIGRVQLNQEDLERRVRLRTAELGEINERLVQEIQKRFRTEEALRQSEERLSLAVKGSDLGLWDWNVVTGHLDFNERLVAMLGYTLREVRPHLSSWEEWMHPDDKPYVTRVLQDHLSGRTEFYETEHRLKARNGGWIWVLDRGQVVQRDEKGQPLRALGTHVDITVRKEAERLLQESHASLETRVAERTADLAQSQERFRQLAENIDEVFWMTDVEKNQMLYVSPAYEKIWGRPCQELLENSRTWLDAICEEDRERVLNATLARQSVGSYDEEYRITRPDGEIRWIRDRAFPVRDESGKVIRVAGIAEDVTASKRTALRNARQEQTLAALTRHPAIHAGHLEAALGVILPAAAETLEVGRASYWSYVVEGDLLHCEQLWGDCGADRKPAPGDLRMADFPRYGAAVKQDRMIAAHDAARDLRTSEFTEPYLKPLGIVSVLDVPVREAGGVVGVVCFEHTGPPRSWMVEEQQFAASVGDVLTLALAAQKRCKDEAQIALLAHALESTREMVAIAGPDNRFLYVNEAFQRGYGYSGAELVGQPAGIVSGSLPEDLMAEIPRRTIAGGWQGELMNRTKDGREFPISLSTSPVFDTAGKLIAMISVVTDLTGRKQTERALLEAAEKERQRIGQDLHDDLCQHLTGIRFKAALLEKKTGAEAGQEEAREIVQMLADATQLARSIARGLQPVEPRPEGLMHALQQLAANTAQTFKLVCHCRFPKPLFVHEGTTATHLYRIAQEAVQNAIKHGAPTCIEIVLEAHGDDLRLTVRDDGQGIQRRQGNGIGLQTMQHRALLVGGLLTVERLSGDAGTQVACVLPHYPSSTPTGRRPQES